MSLTQAANNELFESAPGPVCLAVSRADVLSPSVELPLCGHYYPLGFPLRIYSNSPAVMSAANESWRHFRQRSDRPPLELSIAVTHDHDHGLASTPFCNQQWNILLCIADSHNFVACDLNSGRSFGTVTPSTAQSQLYLQYHFLETAALSMITALHTAPVHAACVARAGSGMLLCGDSGAGKSSLAYAAARRGFVYISDDASYLTLDGPSRRIIGNSHSIRLRTSAPELFPELRGRAATPRAAGKPSIVIPTSELPEITTADSAIIDYIVFLHRRSGAAQTLGPRNRSDVQSWFTQFITSRTTARSYQDAALDQLLSVPIFEMCYHDLEWAVDRLERLAITGE